MFVAMISCAYGCVCVCVCSVLFQRAKALLLRFWRHFLRFEQLYFESFDVPVISVPVVSSTREVQLSLKNDSFVCLS